MRLCSRDGSDRLLTELVKQGINIVLPPRAGIAAGSLLISRGLDPARLASWQVVLGVSPAITSEKEPTFTGMSFSASDALDAEAGGSIAGKVLSSLGLGEGALTTAFKKAGAKTLQLSLTAPAVHALTNLDEVLDALRDGSASPRPGYEDRRFFIVTKVWRARGLSVRLHNETGGLVTLTAAATRELEAAARVAVQDRQDGAITFVAEKALIFGLTLVEIAFNDDMVTDRMVVDHLPIRGEDGPIPVAGDHMFAHAFISDELFSDLETDTV